MAQLYDDKGYTAYKEFIAPVLEKIANNLESIPSEETKKGFFEAFELLAQKEFTVQDVRNMKYFKNIFGREHCYLSLINRNKSHGKKI